MFKSRKRTGATILLILLVSGASYVIGVNSQGGNPTWDELIGMFNVPWFNASTGVNAPEFYRNDDNYTALLEGLVGGVSDHGDLTGLGDDDHSLYLLQSGAEGLTGNWDIGNYDFTAKYITADEFFKTGVGNYSAWVESVGGGVTDHGALTGLSDDDHNLYYLDSDHTQANHDSLSLDHGSLSGLTDDDHTQYLETGEGGVSDHGALTGLGDDDHSLYLRDNEHTVDKNGVLVGTRTGINFNEGENVTLTIVDDAANDQVNITISATGGGEGPMGPAGSGGRHTYDYYLNKTGATYYAYDSNWNVDYSSSDWGTVFNNVMTAINDEGIVAIQGGITYNYAVQPLVSGSGSGLAKQIEIVGVGGGEWPILSPTADNIHGIEFEQGANVDLHRINFAMKTSGTSGSAIYGENAGGGAYMENSLFLARIGDFKITGGTSGVYLIYLEDSEWVEFYGRMYINGATGTNGVHSKVTSGAQYHYGSNHVSGGLYISLNGANTVGVYLEGYSATVSHMNFLSTGRIWVVNDVNSDNVIGMKLRYVKGSYIGGFMTERCTQALVMEYATGITIDGRGLTHLPRSSEAPEANTPFFDLNAGNYANVLTDIHVSYSGTATYIIIDDDQTDTNAPNTVDMWTFTIANVGGTFTAEFGSTVKEQDYGSGRWYTKLGPGTGP